MSFCLLIYLVTFECYILYMKNYSDNSRPRIVLFFTEDLFASVGQLGTLAISDYYFPIRVELFWNWASAVEGWSILGSFLFLGCSLSGPFRVPAQNLNCLPGLSYFDIFKIIPQPHQLVKLIFSFLLSFTSYRIAFREKIVPNVRLISVSGLPPLILWYLSSAFK